MLSTKIKSKKCPICKTEFLPVRMGQKVCGPKCSWLLVEQKKKEDYRKTTRKMRLALTDKDPRHWMQKAQKEFNKWIRERDKDLPCISCGRFHKGQYHAGHYRTIGACSSLRFDERQVNKQCAPCNNHLSGNISGYRINLVKKIGLEAVEDIENTNPLRRWSLEELKEIYHDYRNRNKAV